MSSGDEMMATEFVHAERALSGEALAELRRSAERAFKWATDEGWDWRDTLYAPGAASSALLPPIQDVYELRQVRLTGPSVDGMVTPEMVAICWGKIIVEGEWYL
jgi:hypothetical protein